MQVHEEPVQRDPGHPGRVRQHLHRLRTTRVTPTLRAGQGRQRRSGVSSAIMLQIDYSLNEHGSSICSFGHKFQILGLMWPPRLFEGHSVLNISFSLLVSDWWKFFSHEEQISSKFFKKPVKFLQKSSQITKNQFLHFPHVSHNSIKSEPCLLNRFPNGDWVHPRQSPEMKFKICRHVCL